MYRSVSRKPRLTVDAIYLLFNFVHQIKYIHNL